MAKKLLVIEDDPIILKNTMQILKLEGYDVFGAENGLIGLKYTYQIVPDLIISDISMPGLSGLEVLAQLRADPKTAAIPFIFLTAHSHKEDLRHGMEAGADDYLTKPFDVTDLLTAISVRFERHAAYLQEQERKLNELRGNIIYLLPHELRTPLMTIMGYADMMLDSGDKLEIKAARKGLERIKTGGERLFRLIENYLLYAQLEVIKSDSVQLASIRSHRAERPADIITRQANLQAARVNRSTDLRLTLQDVPAIRISDDALKKIIEELLDNAFKFSQAGTPIELATAVDAGRYWIGITNEGRGMTAEQIANVGAYMQFQRKLYEQQGSGLGLSLVRGLTTIYSGNMTIESVPDQNMTVLVDLALYEGVA
jgi:signal transduction histidine kinase